MIINVFDTETIGLISNSLITLDKQPELFEYYAYRFNDETFEYIDDLHVFAKPSKPMEKGASRATGKKDSDFVSYPKFSENAQRIKDYIESSDVVVAHNAMYDVNILNFEFARIGQTIKWPKIICTVEKTEHLFGYRLSLTALHEYLFGEGFGNAHEADSDVKALGRCYIELVKRGEI